MYDSLQKQNPIAANCCNIFFKNEKNHHIRTLKQTNIKTETTKLNSITYVCNVD